MSYSVRSDSEGWIPSPSRVLLNPCMKWMLLLLHCIDKEVLELPEDVCKIIVEYGREMWIVDHPGMKAITHSSVAVTNYPICAYPCKWSRGVKLSEQQAEFTVTVTQGIDSLMDDRYMIGFTSSESFVHNDYPEGYPGSLICLELDGSLIVGDDTIVPLAEEQLSSVVNVRFTVSVADRRIELRINDRIRNVVIPETANILQNAVFHPFVVLRGGDDKVAMNIENSNLLSQHCPHPR